MLLVLIDLDGTDGAIGSITKAPNDVDAPCHPHPRRMN
jgi:hypothetical protein